MVLEKVLNRFGYHKRENKPRRQKSYFTAAQINRLTSSWTASNLSMNEAIFRDLEVLRARSRELTVNNDYAKHFLTLCKRHVIGPNGIALQSKAQLSDGQPDKAVNDSVELAWKKWSKRSQCDVTGIYSWFKLQQLIMEATARDGEVFIRIVRNFRHNESRFALQVFEADYVDTKLNKELSNGRRVRMGIELDQWDRPVAYYVGKVHPGDNCFGYSYDGEPERIPAEQIIHVFDPLRPGQIRGIPWIHAAMLRLNMLGKYEEAELIAARIAASKMGFFERDEDGGGFEGEESESDDSLIMEAEPGTFDQLPAGVRLTSWDPQHPNTNFGNFIKAAMRGVGAAIGVSYHTLSNDLTEVNFSSIRSGVIEEREGWMAIQNWLIESCHQRVYDAWKETVFLSGFLDVPFKTLEKLPDPCWIARRWPWVDPLKDMKANELGARMGVRSISDIIRETGRDPDDVFTQVAADKERLKAMGLEAVSNYIYGGRVNATGSEPVKNSSGENDDSGDGEAKD